MERKRILISDNAQFELFALVNGRYLLRYTPGRLNEIGNFVPSGEPIETLLALPDDQAIVDGSAELTVYLAKFGI